MFIWYFKNLKRNGHSMNENLIINHYCIFASKTLLSFHPSICLGSILFSEVISFCFVHLFLLQANNKSNNNKKEMTVFLSVFKSLLSQLLRLVGIVPLSLNSESAEKQPFSIFSQPQKVIGIGIKITFCFMMCGLMKVLNHSK